MSFLRAISPTLLDARTRAEARDYMSHQEGFYATSPELLTEFLFCSIHSPERYSEHGQQNEPGSTPGNVVHDDPVDAQPGPASWICHCEADSRLVERRSGDRRRI